MLIPKMLKKEPNDRPLRPKTGIKSEKSICHLSRASFECEEDVWEDRIRVDAEPAAEFGEKLKENFPKNECVWCPDIEVWYVSMHHKETLVTLAEEHFDSVKKELRKWQT